MNWYFLYIYGNFIMVTRTSKVSIYSLLVIFTTYNALFIVNCNLMYKRYLANNLGICSTYMPQKTLNSKPHVERPSSELSLFEL